MTLGTSDQYRIGMHWQTGNRFDLTLVGDRRETGSEPAQHSDLLKSEVSY